MTDKRSTVLCTTMSTLLVCSSPETESVVLPGATAVTTPVSETRATLGSAEDHCIVRGLTTRPPCPGTTTCSVSTSLGPSPVALGPNEVDTLHVVVPGQGGRVVSPLTMQWSSADPNVARVSLTGVVTAVAPGKTTLSVSGLLQTKSVDIVVHRTLQGLQVRPKVQGEIPVPMQGTARFEAHALGADDQPVPEAPLRWIVGDTTLASFDPATGVLTGRKAGKTQLVVKGPGLGLAYTWAIRIIAAGLKLSATRLGLPLNRRYGLRANFADETGAVIGPATAVTFASDNPPAVAVAEDGTIPAAGYGHARVTASAPGGKHAAVDVFVQGEIVVASSRSGRLQLYAAERANLAQLRKVLDDSATAAEPAYSPDGSRLAFVSRS